MPHGRHNYQTVYDIDTAKMCAYPPSQHEVTHSKYVLLRCDNFPCIDLPIQESDKHNFNTCTTIFFHLYHLTSCHIVHGGCPLNK